MDRVETIGKDNRHIANQPRKWMTLLALVAALSMAYGCCAWFGDSYETVENVEAQYYAINPATIFESLDQGNTDVFKLLETTPQAMPLPSSGSVFWSQADFIRVAQALYQTAWNEPFDEQNIYVMDFEMDCEEIEQGLFSEAELLSFRIVQTGKQQTRIEYHLFIYPPERLVYTVKGEHTPNIQKKKPLDLARYRISAEEALQIAEKNGGAEKRLKYENDCKVNVSAIGSYSQDWEVSYKNNRAGRWILFFEIAIDPQNGKHKILYPKP